MIICQSHEDVNIEKRHLNTLLNAQVDGIFMSVSKTTLDTEHIQNILDTSNTPIIFFDRKKDIAGISTVTIDDYRGGYIAAEHLISEVYKNICHFAGDLNLEIYQNRLNGYKQALTDHHLTVKNENIIYTGSTIEAGIEAIKTLWNKKSIPDAIFSSSDFAALGACQEIIIANNRSSKTVLRINY
ncbi:substrate-binding domain-containing protein [Chryseobacterium sp. SSA4.19]|uniref:substrate-binding domain-containing protein n=1 Tax=Chryseobacterium sp. SSA4.19 TaxID=2919915 RepID=UPI001F4ED271|nr:substrate-binding domain-containing protein [Chryseobacterium sp. SSA4.19]